MISSPWTRRTMLAARAFTLIELLVSMTVLVILVALISQLVNSATSVTVGNRQRLDADSQARVVFDRMAFDISRMLKRPDVDYFFAKTDGAGGGENDKMFFYSEAPAIYDGDATKPAARSSVALVGYRINNGYQLERLGKLLTWDGAAAAATPGGVIFLSPGATPAGGGAPITNPDPASTFVGDGANTTGGWTATIGNASDVPPYSNPTDFGDYQVLAPQVCRMEICFQLTDGSYSAIPLLKATGASPPNNSLTLARSPKPSDDLNSSPAFTAGSKWYDPSVGRAFVCVNNAAGAAVWNPLGLQDVRAIVVALAILDSSSARIVPTASKTINGQASQVPDLSKLVLVLQDATIKDASTAGGVSTDKTVPNLAAAPTPRLMAEAWSNEINNVNNDGGYKANSGLPLRTGEQVRVYQRAFVLNNL